MSHRHLQTKQITKVPKSLVKKMVTQALAEDIGQGDINALLINKDKQAYARVITREPMVMCGYDWVKEVFKQVDPNLKIHWYHNDADEVATNKPLFEVKGLARSILSAERNALNFLQMLSAVATKTREYINAIKGTDCIILDTRKTIPGFRLAQKYAVTCAGGMNHRIGLFDAFLIKDNHIAACDHSITKAIEKAREIMPQKMVEVEVENFEELNEALKAHADVVMLDNFSLRDMQKAVNMAKGRAQLEASGNMSLNKIYAIAKTGIDFISIGALTKNITAIDLSMRFL